MDDSTTTTETQPTPITPRVARKMLGVSAQTLVNWAKLGKLRYYRTPAGRMRYDPRDVDRILRGE